MKYSCTECEVDLMKINPLYRYVTIQGECALDICIICMLNRCRNFDHRKKAKLYWNMVQAEGDTFMEMKFEHHEAYMKKYKNEVWREVCGKMMIDCWKIGL